MALPQMFASPISRCRLIFCGLAVVAGAEIGSPFRIFVLCEILVAASAKRNLLDFVALFPEDHELFLGASGGFLGFIESGELFPHVLDLSGRESFESRGGHAGTM
jgi:hypothetical protein